MKALAYHGPGSSKAWEAIPCPVQVQPGVVVNNAEQDPVLAVMELTGGLGADVVIEAVGVFCRGADTGALKVVLTR